VSHQRQRLFKPKSFDEVGERHPNQRSEDTVKVERRKHRGARYVFKPQRVSEVTHDVVNREIDALNVGGQCCGTGLHESSQDLASRLHSVLYYLDLCHLDRAGVISAASVESQISQRKGE
jgi:hypothetical protein